MDEWIEIPKELLPQFSEAVELGYTTSYAELCVPSSNDYTTLILVRSEDENTLDRLEIGVTSLLWELLEGLEG